MVKLKTYIKKIKDAFLDEFSSIKLAITLFIFLAITTLIGTVLPEEPMIGAAELIQKYGPEKYRFLRSLGLTDVFHSWWYLALLTTFGINLIVASFKRVFPKWRIAFMWPVEMKEENIKKLPVNCELLLSDKLGLKNLEKKLNEKSYKTKVDKTNLLAMKGGWHRLGASVTHIGILTLLIGCGITTLTGFNGMAQVAEDEGFYLTDLGDKSIQIRSIEPENWLAPISKMPIWLGRLPSYLIKVNKTWRVDYKSGQPKQWYSDLSVYDQNKKELTRKTIHVNDPLEFMGLDIYQSNWGKFSQITFNNQSATLPLENFRGEDVVILPIGQGLGLKLKVAGKKQEEMKMSNKSHITQDILEIYSVSTENEFKEKYLGQVGKGKNIQLGPMNIGYLGTQTLTGLQFKSNPGDILIYPGLFFIIAGVFIAFGSKKQIWACLNENSNKIVIGGNSDRAKGKFFQEFEELISNLVTN